MTTTEQRNADEALGRAARQLDAHARRLDLAVGKRKLFGQWTVEVISTSNTLHLHASGDTELEAIDKLLDQLNHVDVVVV